MKENEKKPKKDVYIDDFKRKDGEYAPVGDTKTDNFKARDVFGIKILDLSGVKNLKNIGSKLTDALLFVKKIIFPQSLEVIDDNFMYCKHSFSENENVDLSYLKNLKKIGVQAFDSSNILGIKLPKSIEEIGADAFASCEKLCEADFSKAKNLHAISAGLFAESALSDIELPKGIDTIEDGAFRHCKNLREIDWENLNRIKEIGAEAFIQTGIKNIKLPASIENLYDSAFSECWNLDVADFSKSKKISVLYQRLFQNSSIKKFIPNKKIKYIFNNCFTLCKDLKEIDTAKFSGLKKIGREAFKECENLENFDFLKLGNLTTIGSKAFLGSGIRELNVDKSLEHIGEYAFANCINLKNVDLTKCKISSIQNGTFAGCINLESIKMPKGKKIPIGEMAFSDCFKNIKDFKVIEDIVNSASEINVSAFSPEITMKLIDKGYNISFDENNNYVPIDSDIKMDQLKTILEKTKELEPFYIKIYGMENRSLDELKPMLDMIAGYKKDIILSKDIEAENINVRESKAPYIYNEEEFKRLDDINDYFNKKSGKEILYQEFFERNFIIKDENCWEHSKVKEANRKLDEIAKEIKEKGLSPLEAMIHIHEFATKFKYKENSLIREKARNPISIMTEENPEIVCVGYATLVKSIIDKLNMPGLTCKLNGCRIPSDFNLNAYSGHATNIIKIDDKEYGIKGDFYEDACSDSVSDEAIEKGICKSGFAYFLIPITDTEKMKDNAHLMIENQYKEFYTYGISDTFYNNEDFEKNRKSFYYAREKNKIDIDLLTYLRGMKAKGADEKQINYIFETYASVIVEEIENDLRSIEVKNSLFSGISLPFLDPLDKNALRDKKEYKKIIENYLKSKTKDICENLIDKDLNVIDEELAKALKRDAEITKNGYLIIEKESGEEGKTLIDVSRAIIEEYNKIEKPMTMENFSRAYLDYCKKMGIDNVKQRLQEIKEKGKEECLRVYDSSASNIFVSDFKDKDGQIISPYDYAEKSSGIGKVIETFFKNLKENDNKKDDKKVTMPAKEDSMKKE